MKREDVSSSLFLLRNRVRILHAEKQHNRTEFWTVYVRGMTFRMQSIPVCRPGRDPRLEWSIESVFPAGVDWSSMGCISGSVRLATGPEIEGISICVVCLNGYLDGLPCLDRYIGWRNHHGCGVDSSVGLECEIVGLLQVGE